MAETSPLLIYLSEKGLIYKEAELSTITISKDLNDSQQTVSRKLLLLEKNGLITRSPSTRGIRIKVTEKGASQIKDLYLRLKGIVENRIYTLTGTVESGLGEGSYYVSLKKYHDQFQKKLDISPYNGTLNIRVDYPKFMQFIAYQNKIIIEGFETENRSFGEIIAYNIKLNNTPAAIIIPKRTSHERDIIEIISTDCLRKKFDLKDHDQVKISAGIR